MELEEWCYREAVHVVASGLRKELAALRSDPLLDPVAVEGFLTGLKGVLRSGLYTLADLGTSPAEVLFLSTILITH